MLRLIACCLMMTAMAVRANAEHPAGYWDKIYGSGYVSAGNYGVSLQAKNAAKAASDADQRITKAGGRLVNMNASGTYELGSRKLRTYTYSVDSKRAESLAKSLFDLGELASFTATHGNANTDADEIRSKLNELAAEKSGSSECLAKTPIASVLLEGKISQLKQALTAIETRDDKATLTLSFVDISPKGSQ